MGDIGKSLGVLAVFCFLSGCAENPDTIIESLEGGGGTQPQVFDEPLGSGGQGTGGMVASGDGDATGGVLGSGGSISAGDGDGDGDVDVDASPADADGDAEVTPPAPVDPLAPGDRTPSPDNAAECPAEAPADPWGPCAGLPVYLQCNYTTYNCICDWIHWICV